MPREKRQKASQDVSGDESPPIRFPRCRLGKEKVVEAAMAAALVLVLGLPGNPTTVQFRFGMLTVVKEVMLLIQEVVGEVVVAVLGLEGHLMISL